MKTRDNVIALMFEFIMSESDTYSDFRDYAEVSYDEMQDALTEFRRDQKWEAIVTEEGRIRWKAVHGVITPGGDPAYECPICGGGRHLNGVESYKNWKYCPDCGTRLEY